ncbi:MAG: hypothetical protein F6K54_27850 [Okeania sp. SIO3B5]|uniref:hypothetical protein n=1 Tax=Okeania sp. SIO3B5 TaxID=2607811 RepID=UPI00140062BF|nr:hypothetical protein [Okeania sp. SIO3B5]NEO56557.1 hypothetical protein [Okeania sp. SIO3B5]
MNQKLGKNQQDLLKKYFTDGYNSGVRNQELEIGINMKSLSKGKQRIEEIGDFFGYPRGIIVHKNIVKG